MSEEKKLKIFLKSEISITEKAFDNLIEFLLTRESDIALDIEDFGALKELYFDIFEEIPMEQKEE